LYIRKDVAAQIWNYGVGPSASSVPVDPYEKGTINLEADFSFGTAGQSEGQLNGPHGITVAPDGTLYVADTNNSRIEHFSADGQLINSWGYFADGTTSVAPLTGLNQPWGVAVSPDGQWVYVADTWNHRIVKYSADGKPVTSWGSAQYGGQNPFGLWGPRGIAVDAKGNVFVSDTGNKRIVAYTANGKYIGEIGSEGMDPGQFSEPVGLAFDTLGNLYVADTWNQRIQSFSVVSNSDGTLNFISLLQWDIAGWFGQSLENKPYLAIDGQNHIFVTDPDLGRVLEFTATGKFVHTWGGPGQFGLASGITVDSQGRVWVSDSLNARLMRFVVP
jgi:sugar lactone lactonase YvrE